MAKAQPGIPALGYRFPLDPDDIPTHRPERELFTTAGWGKGIYAAAISRTLSPVALTVAVLIDVAAQLGPQVLIDTPGSDGVQGGLAAMLIGRSGAGKTATMTAARSVVELRPEVRPMTVAGATPTEPLVRLGGLASGQALGERLKTTAAECLGTSGDVIGYDYDQEHDRALVCFDEGSSLVKTSSGEGSILLETITSALTGGSLDGVRANREQSRVVPGGSYTASFMLGIQPGLAAPLLGQDSLGFTQRWLVIPALPDPADELCGVVLPRVETRVVRAPIAWLEPRKRPDMTVGWTAPANRSAAELVPVDAAVVEEMARNRFRMARSDFDGDLLDAHRDLFRLKLALPIALLEGERRISPRAWELAGIIMDISAETRDRAITEARDIAAAAATEKEVARSEARAAAEEAKVAGAPAKVLAIISAAGAAGLSDADWRIAHRNRFDRRRNGGASTPYEAASEALRDYVADGEVVHQAGRYYIKKFAPAPLPSFAEMTSAAWDANADDDTDYPLNATPAPVLSIAGH